MLRFLVDFAPYAAVALVGVAAAAVMIPVERRWVRERAEEEARDARTAAILAEVEARAHERMLSTVPISVVEVSA